MVAFLLSVYLHQVTAKDVSIPGTPLDKAFVQLGAIYNSQMIASPVFKDKVILIDAKQVTEEEVRGQIAKTLNATWEKKEDGWHLTKTAKEVREDEARAAGMRLRFLKKTFEMREKSLDGKKTLTKEFATQTYRQLVNEAKNADPNQMRRPGPSPAGYNLPNQRFFSRFLLKFGFERIAAIPNGHRVVFAMNPNKMQEKITIDFSDELAQYRSEQETWFKTVEPLLKDQESNAKETTNSGGIRLGYSEEDSDELAASFGMMPNDLQDILFTVYCSEDGAYQMKMIGVPKNTENNIIYRIGGTSYEGAFAGMEAGDFEVKPVEGFKLSEESEDFKKFFMGQTAQIPDTRRTAFLAKLADPTGKDPLAYGLSESIIFDCRRMKYNIVALLSDNSLNIFEPIFGDAYFNEKFADLSKDFVAKDGKWIEMREFPFQEPNFPRGDLKRIIANVRGNGKVGLYDRAKIAAIRPRTNAVSYVERLIEKFVNTPNEEFGEVDALKIIGLLNDSEQQRAFGKQGIRFGDLNQRLQQHLFECCYYNDHSRISVTDDRLRNGSIQSSEATYLAPIGVVPDAIFRVEQKIEEQIKDPDEPGQSNLMANAASWGSTKYQLDHPDEFPGANFKFDLTRKLHRVRITSYTLKLLVSPNAAWSSMLQNVEKPDSATFTLATLPDDLKADFEAGYKKAAEAAEARKKRKAGGGTAQQK